MEILLFDTVEDPISFVDDAGPVPASTSFRKSSGADDALAVSAVLVPCSVAISDVWLVMAEALLVLLRLFWLSQVVLNRSRLPSHQP